MKNKINVYSEIGNLKTVLVHTPGKEIDYLTPSRLEELLFSSILNSDRARKEHEKFINILNKEGVNTIQLIDLVAETYNLSTNEIKDEFINKWLDEAIPVLSIQNKEIIYKYLKSLESNPKIMIKKMMSGILNREVNINSKVELIVDPMPNLYFARDPFASIGNGVIINNMFRETRRRETIFSWFIFTYHPNYKNTPIYYDRNHKYSIEGGDIFIYDKKTLVIGHSERTSKEAIELLANNIKKNNIGFERIFVINVPKMSNLMHLDTWLVMLDYDKFLYSPNMMDVLKIWEINLNENPIKWKILNKTLEDFLSYVTEKKVTLIPVAGKNATQIDIDVETNFDATNYIVIKPGVVIGYDRNKKTNQALKAAGIKVLTWKGDQLSLGMGSARCMTMPLYREDIE